MIAKELRDLGFEHWSSSRLVAYHRSRPYNENIRGKAEAAVTRRRQVKS